MQAVLCRQVLLGNLNRPLLPGVLDTTLDTAHPGYNEDHIITAKCACLRVQLWQSARRTHACMHTLALVTAAGELGARFCAAGLSARMSAQQGVQMSSAWQSGCAVPNSPGRPLLGTCQNLLIPDPAPCCWQGREVALTARGI